MLRSTQSDRRRPDAQAGFTLIEVLVALTIVAVTLPAIGSVIATNVRGIRSIDHRLALAGVVQTLMANLPNRDVLKPGTQTGELAGHRWRVDVSPLGASAAAPASDWAPMAVTVRVQATEGHAIQMTTVRLVRRGGG